MKKSLDPMVKSLLELGPVLAFFVGFFLFKDHVFTIYGVEYKGFIIVTALFIPLIFLTTFLMWYLTGKIPKMQLVTLILVTIFGGMTIWFNDEQFFKMKPTILYLSFALILWVGLLRGQSYLGNLMGEAVEISQKGWQIITRRLAMFFLAMALVNEILWRSFSTELWVTFKTFGAPIAITVFFLAQFSVFNRHKKD